MRVTIGVLSVIYGVATIMAQYQFLTDVLTKPTTRRNYNKGWAIGYAEAHAERLAKLEARRRAEASIETIAATKPEGWREG